jgi:hypothetical protein
MMSPLLDVTSSAGASCANAGNAGMLIAEHSSANFNDDLVRSLMPMLPIFCVASRDVRRGIEHNSLIMQ